MIREWMEQAAQQRPNAKALSCEVSAKSLDYQALCELVAERAKGIASGSLVPMNPTRRLDDAVDLLATVWAGAIPQLGSDLQGPLPGPGTVFRLHTSGSTGEPSPVDLTARQLQASILASAERLEQSPDDSWACVLPLSHIGGLSILLRCLQSQSEAVLVGGSFDPERCSWLCQEGRVSQISLVPNQLQRMMPFLERQPVSDRLRLILLGGAAASEALMEHAKRLQLPVARTWGMSECGSQVATERPGEFASRLQPLPGVRVSRDDASGRLWIEGDIAPDGRFLSSDVGDVNADGVRIEGRMDDICVSGGENLSLIKIQRALLAHSGVREAVVLKRPCPEWGERPHAVMVATGGEVSDGDLRAFLKAQGLRKRELPDTLEWLAELPRTSLGKIRRGLL